MALPVVISPTQTDAKSPVDDDLMDGIRVDLNDLDSRFNGVKTFAYEFKVNGPLSFLLPSYGIYKRLDGALVPSAQTLTFARMYCEIPGTSGTLIADIRKYRRTNTAITAIAKQFTSSITSITQIAPAIATQSISRATGQIATQSITRWKSTINISSIILLGNNLVRYNLASALDSDWKQGDSITFASATNAANNGNFTIVRVNDDGLDNIVITNASGVAQTGAVGNVVLNAWAYNFTNPVNAQFVAGESATFASHTSGGNNGTFTIYALNTGGNNIIVKNVGGVAQGAAAGTTDVNRWTYTYSAAVASDFVVGEFARMASHTTGANNGDFRITGVNVSGNNIIVFNAAGVAQGAAAGTANTTRWIYALSSDPTSQYVVGQCAVITGAITGANNGTFTVMQINRLGTNNLVVVNTTGVTQAGAAGTLDHERTILSFASDQSAIYTTQSNIEIGGTLPSAGNLGQFDVVEVNRGGGANYNVVINNILSVAQASPAGRILIESKSILNSFLSLSFPTGSTENTNNNSWLQAVSTSSLNANAVISLADVSNGVLLALDILSIPSGAVADVVVQLV